MAKTVREYLSRKTVGGYLERKRLEEQIGLDTYAADLANYSKSVGEGGDAFGSAESFAGAKQSAESLLSRTKALQEYVKRYGGDATGLDVTSEWLTSQQGYFGKFADYADYQNQKQNYERLSQNYDFKDAAERLAKLKEQEAALPGRFKAFLTDLMHEASGELYVSDNDTRKSLQEQIRALENEIGQARYYQAEGVESAADFDNVSQVVTSNPNGLKFGDEGSDNVDWEHEYINNGFDRSIGSWYAGEVLGDLSKSIRLDALREMTDSEIKRYNYIYNKQGKEAAGQYLNGIYDTLYGRTLQRVSEFGKEHPVLGTLGSLGGSVMGAFEEVGNVLAGNTAEYNISADFGDTFRSGVASGIEGDFTTFLYNTGVSALQSLAVSAVFGKAGGAVLGLSSMASTRNDLLRRGADPDTALKAGIAAGIFEGLFETVSLGQLDCLKEVPVHQFKDLVKNVAKSIGVNASEEAFTEIANILYDTFANGDFSEAQQMLNQGMSETEIAKAFGAQIVESAASGGLMGAGFGTFGSAVSGISSAVVDKEVGKAVKQGLSPLGDVSELIAKGEQEGIKQAAQVKEKGESASNRAVGDLHRRVAMLQASKNQAKTKAAIKERLSELGVNEKKTDKLAQTVLKKHLGQDLSISEDFLLTGSEQARQTLRELEGEGNARWRNELLRSMRGDELQKSATAKAESAEDATARAAEIPQSSNGQVQQAGTGTTLGTRPTVVGVQNSAVTLAGENGAEVAFSDTAMPEDLALLYSLAGLFSDVGSANDFVQNWDGKSNPHTYFKAYDLIRLYGRNHAGYTDAEVLKKGSDYGLSEAQTRSAFKNGMSSLAEERRAQREKLEEIAHKFRESGAARKEGKYDASGIRGLDLAELSKKNPAMKDVRAYISFLRLMSQAFGMNVRIVANPAEGAARGSFSPKTNTLTFNIYAGTMYGNELWSSALPNVISHESVHWMRLNAPAEYAVLEDMVFEALKKTSDYDFSEAVQREFGKYQQRYGREITDAEAREEIVARACEDLFGRSEALQSFLADFAEKNKSAANKFVAAVKKILDNIKKFFSELLNGVRSSKTAEAKIINHCGLDTLKALQTQFDKTFLAAIEGNAARNAFNEYEQGGELYSYAGEHAKIANVGTFAIARQMAFEGTDSETIRQKTGWFQGYDGKWRFEIDDSDVEFAFNGKLSRDPDVRRYAELVEKAYFDGSATQAEQSELAALDKKIGKKSVVPDKLGDMMQHPTLFEAYPQLADLTVRFTDGANSASYHAGAKEITVPKRLKMDPKKFKSVILHEVQHAMQDIERFASGSNVNMFADTEGSSAYDQYYNTAGEIESRDVANRANLTAEQRKNTRPDIDRSDVVFAENGGENFSYIGDTVDNRRCYKSGFDSSVDMGDRIKMFKQRISTIFNLGAVKLKTDVKKIQIQGDKFTAQKNMYGDKIGETHEYEAKISALYDLADILATSTYDPSATAQEVSYTNPNVPPKNAAHKGVKYWYKFRNEIVFDGVPYTVTFNIRDKGKNQYQYLIDFKENKTSGLSNTAVKNLLRADQMSYDTSISQNSGKSTPQAQENAENLPGMDSNELFSDPADDEKSAREVLSAALMGAAQNEVERNALKVYQQRIKKLDGMTRRLAEVKAEIQSMMFQRGTRDDTYTQRLEALKQEKEKLERGVSQGDSKLLKLEATRSLQALLERERQKTAKLWIDAGRKKMNNYRERNLVQMYSGKIEEKAKALRRMLLENSEKYHIPDAFKIPVASFLALLDFSSDRLLAGGDPTRHDQEIQKRFEEVRVLLESIANENSDEFLRGLDLPPDAVDEFTALAKEVSQMAIEGEKNGAMVLHRMSSEQLNTLNSTLYAMTRAVRQANELFATERFRHVSELSLDAIGTWEQYAAKSKRSKVSDFLTWENLTPYYAFRRLGKAGEALFDGFRRGQSQFAFLSKEIMNFTGHLYNKDEVRAWERRVHTFKSEQGEFYMTTAQIMTLYELWKDKDAKQHLLGGGVRIEDIAFGVKKKYTNDANGTTLNELLVDEILSKLTARQKAVADGLQKFMAEQCAEWGNEVSYKRWGIKLFGLDYYSPIESDRNTMASDVSQKAKENGLFTLLHKSFTKKRVFRANNRIMIRSVFDVFASHATDMAKYKSFALPLLDMQKFINFKEIVRPGDEGGAAYSLPSEGESKDASFTTKEVRASMEKAFGAAAYQYIEQFLIDLNGNMGGRSAAEGVLQSGVTANKVAAVAANLRVALLQPTAYVRALNVLDSKYFFGGLKAMGHLPSCIRKMEKYSGIALWKSLGYRDTNIATPLQTKIKHAEGLKDKVVEKSMFLAELGDKVTWGALWYACELETRDKKTTLKVGSEEYYAAVAERFEEVIYATQVVDSVFAKSQLMRRKDFLATLFTSFMSEPTLSYNLLASNALDIMDKKRRGEKVSKTDVKPFVRAVGVFAVGAVVQALVESVVDAARDMGEDDEEYGEKYWNEFLSNALQEIMPFNLVPIVKDIWSIGTSTARGDYMSSSRIDLEVYNRLARAVKTVGKMLENGEVSYSDVHKILSAISSLTGLPISNLLREVLAIWNAVMGSINPSLVVH